jgi:hypothetical protein
LTSIYVLRPWKPRTLDRRERGIPKATIADRKAMAWPW